MFIHDQVDLSDEESDMFCSDRSQEVKSFSPFPKGTEPYTNRSITGLLHRALVQLHQPVCPFGVSKNQQQSGTWKPMKSDGTRNEGYTLWDGGYIFWEYLYTGSFYLGMSILAEARSFHFCSQIHLNCQTPTVSDFRCFWWMPLPRLPDVSPSPNQHHTKCLRTKRISFIREYSSFRGSTRSWHHRQPLWRVGQIIGIDFLIAQWNPSCRSSSLQTHSHQIVNTTVALFTTFTSKGEIPTTSNSRQIIIGCSVNDWWA